MKKTLLASMAAAVLAVSTLSVSAQMKDPDVGGAPMYPTKTVVENASAAPNLSTLVAAVKAAGLVHTLSGKGPFTVFAPDNDAFKMDSKVIAKAIKKGHGTATLKTVEGGTLTAKMDGTKLVLTDEKGGTSTVTTADVYQSNGVAHVVDTVLMPN